MFAALSFHGNCNYRFLPSTFEIGFHMCQNVARANLITQNLFQRDRVAGCVAFIFYLSNKEDNSDFYINPFQKVYGTLQERLRTTTPDLLHEARQFLRNFADLNRESRPLISYKCILADIYARMLSWTTNHPECCLEILSGFSNLKNLITQTPAMSNNLSSIESNMENLRLMMELPTSSSQATAKDRAPSHYWASDFRQ
jgi:hypothetical protein